MRIVKQIAIVLFAVAMLASSASAQAPEKRKVNIATASLGLPCPICR